MTRNLLGLMVLFASFAFVSCMDVHKTDECNNCPPCVDADGDGHCSVATGGDDCNDNDPDIHPGAVDVCGDSRDSNCDGLNDRCEDCSDGADNNDDGLIDCDDPQCEDDPACLCEDEDEDGFCVEDDCDDRDPDINPDAPEICDDGADNDCDGEVDEDDSECGPDCEDADDDGYCSEDDGGSDCDDRRASVHPGATEICDNGRDDDCDGVIDEGCGCTDCDGDGYDSVSSGGSDCNDSNASVHPGATESCDGVDNDCDGTVDEGCTSVELNCSNGLDDDSDGRIDCADPDCYGLSGCPIPGSEACYRFTYHTPSGQLASSIRVDGTYCLPTYGCSSWFMPLHDTATPANRLEVSSSSVLTGTLRLEAGADFEVNVRSVVMGLEHWYCSYGASRVPPAEHYGTLTIEESADCSTGWTSMTLYDYDLGSGSSDCNVRTWL